MQYIYITLPHIHDFLITFININQLPPIFLTNFPIMKLITIFSITLFFTSSIAMMPRSGGSSSSDSDAQRQLEIQQYYQTMTPAQREQDKLEAETLRGGAQQSIDPNVAQAHLRAIQILKAERNGLQEYVNKGWYVYIVLDDGDHHWRATKEQPMNSEYANKVVINPDSIYPEAKYEFPSTN